MKLNLCKPGLLFIAMIAASLIAPMHSANAEEDYLSKIFSDNGVPLNKVNSKLKKILDDSVAKADFLGCLKKEDKEDWPKKCDPLLKGDSYKDYAP